MNQPYFVVVLAHSLHGKLRRVHISYHFVYVLLALAFVGALSVFGFLSSYVRMTLKVSNYNSLRSEFEMLRSRYDRLDKESRQKGTQLASLQLLANEVSLAYGLKRSLEGPDDISHEGRLVPTVTESLEQYDFLKNANPSTYFGRSNPLFQTNMLPSIWPVEGRLISYFGLRSDPFSGEGRTHTGVDISASQGTQIEATADGIVVNAQWTGDYGKLVVVDHGNGFETYYAHLSQFQVVPGQMIRRGMIVGLAGSTGRSTSAHLHYEVRRGGIPINPHRYLRTTFAQAAVKTRDYGF